MREYRGALDIGRERGDNLWHIAGRACRPNAQAGFFKNAQRVLNPFCDRKPETIIDWRQHDRQTRHWPEHDFGRIDRRLAAVRRQPRDVHADDETSLKRPPARLRPLPRDPAWRLLALRQLDARASLARCLEGCAPTCCGQVGCPTAGFRLCGASHHAALSEVERRGTTESDVLLCSGPILLLAHASRSADA
jgi:hypothetical protein